MKLIRFFVEKHKRGFADPKPSIFFIPEWYKKAETSYLNIDGEVSFGLKKCMPYLDALTSGYMLTTPIDIYINQDSDNLVHIFNNKDNSLSIKWGGPPDFANFIAERPKESGYTMPRPAGHYPNHLVFRGFWSIKTPKGYSLLMTSPLNRHDLPFTLASGIIDSDKYFAPGNMPFFVKKDFEGVVPKGTPIAQLIPIKRENWQAFDNDPYLAEKDMIHGAMARTKESNYKKYFWQKKRYE